MGKRIFRPFRPVAIAAAVLVAGCGMANVPRVGDVVLVAVDVIPGAQVRDPGNALGDRVAGPMIRATFSSQDDYQDIATRWRYEIGTVIGLCNRSEVDAGRQLDNFPDVYDQSAMVDRSRPARFGLSRKGSAGPILYHIYFAPRRVYKNPRRDALDTRHEVSYDFARRPEDVCFRIGGGREDGLLGFSTDAVRIPKKLMLDAVRSAHLKCGVEGAHCAQ